MGIGPAAVAATACRWHLAKVVLAAGMAAVVAGGGGGSAHARTAGQAPGPARAVVARPGGPRGVTPAAAAGSSTVSCPGPAGCMVVGGGTAEWWNGRTWRVLNPAGFARTSLNAVSCTSASRCVAVGATRTARRSLAFAGQWNGRRWRVLKTRDPSHFDVLTGVSCVSSADCVAVGADQGNLFLAEQWNGRTWQLLTVPTPAGALFGSGLSAIACTSASQCMAVGSFHTKSQPGSPVAESWNGTRWRLLPVPDPAGTSSLSSVSCGGPSSCMAVGAGAGHPLAEAWNGSNWTVASPASPAAGGLGSVSCMRPSLCMATGSNYAPLSGSSTLAEEWNGSTWQILATPSPGDSAVLTGLSCTRGPGCLAVGSYQQRIGGALAEKWDGTTWRVARTGKIDDLSGISCPLASRCIAVGSYLNGSDVVDTLALAWNGTTWRTLRTPSPGPHYSELSAVSCASPSRCMAIGSYSTFDAFGGTSLAETWNGTTWALATSGLDDQPGTPQLAGLACPAPATCVAAGYADPGDTTTAIAEAWNGTTWHALSPAVPAGAVFSELNAISCTSPVNCMAVGNYLTNPEFSFVTLAETWNGSTWHILPTPNIGNINEDSELTSVSCTRSSHCMAVGSLTMTWNGSTWRRLATPVPGYLLGVSCAAARACVAVGYLGYQGPIAEYWNGSRWQMLKTPPLSPYLPSVSCTRASNCLTAGQANDRTLAQTWNGTRWHTLTTPDP